MTVLSPPFSGGESDGDYWTAESDAENIVPSTETSPLKRKNPREPVGPPDKRARRLAPGDPIQEDEAQRLIVLNKILKEKFRHTSFRHQQREVIQSVLDGNNTLVVFPTGAGKSLCFQIPALAFVEFDDESRRGKHGITVVISPLLALIKDQVDSLKKKGIAAGALDSTQTAEEYRQTHAAIKAGTLRIVYCSPEKLNTKGFARRLKQTPGGVRLVAVDEAHCVSEWGHAFRPDYLKVARFVKQVEAERVICLTATATAAVTESICEAFQIDKGFQVAPEHGEGIPAQSELLVDSCNGQISDRRSDGPLPALQIMRAEHENSGNVFRTLPHRSNLWLGVEHTEGYEGKIARAIRYVQQNPGPTIIYALFVKQVDDITQRLKKAGYRAESFYARMPIAQKRQTQEAFMAGEIRIIVCTVAFGLGVDKADIRNIIQIGLPRSVEEYSQQCGRAGRDGLPAKCVLYIQPDDYELRKKLEISGFPSKEAVRALLKNLFEIRCRALEAGNILTINQHEQVNKSFDKKKRIDAWTIEYVYAALELRFGILHHLPRREAAGQMRDDAASYLEQYGYNAKFRLRVAPRDVNVNQVAQDIWSEMKTRLDERIWRAAQMMQLASGKRCIALGLAEHFGAGLPGGALSCGNCSVCARHVGVPPPQGFEQEMLSCSQLAMTKEKEAKWGFSQVPILEAESESEDEEAVAKAFDQQ
ncbi:ATP-dependent DNA helicase RecQ [Madurella mycetomatis]|uniref:DNA 3'-5' helicase n=1 Tax=Madurella mycetomatis TaxID=100816 RepID=A0A175W3C9_9PEZI|nr:ATP-dependent DNA helicase RecQ [Madurella mycetomatis]